MSHPDLALAESVTTTNELYFIFVYILILIYCCFGLAIVCDAYFVPALQKLSHTYDLPPDIAGSTLMALGASVPELFASLIGVFVTEDDIGTGSIIGSSCFNLIAVPAACAFVASASFAHELTISPRPVMRNAAFYAITILVLLLIIKDNKVDLIEAVILLIFFAMYMALMIFSAQGKSGSGQQSIQSSRQQQQQQHQDSIANNSAASSLQSSYVSNDSAIAECNYSRKGQLKSNNNNNNNNKNWNSIKTSTQQQQLSATNTTKRHTYGQLCFEPKDSQLIAGQTINTVHSRQDQQRGPNERTPLVTSYAITPMYQTDNNNKLANSLPSLTNFSQLQYYSFRPPTYEQSNEYLSNQAHDHVQQQQQQQQQHQDRNDSRLTDSVRINLDCVMKNSTCLAQHNLIEFSNEYEQQQQQLQSSFKSNGKMRRVDSGDDSDDMHEENWVSSKWILVPMLPLTLSMKALAPCKFRTTCSTIWTFILSVTLIGALTYVSVWMVHLFSQSVGIPETIAGMTILSWGTGIPELIASIVLIKKTAQVDMAICNTIGSNVIDVSFCLSLPWIVKCLLNKTAGLKPTVSIQSSALPWTTFTLLVSVLLLISILKLHDWVLGFRAGVWLTIVYIAFVAVATYCEYMFKDTGFDLLAYF